ncbi:MAG: ribose-phosphate pyrophosphokinase [Desulfobulbaceae bacterium A2]|nr:MAG: ribose-phosphate pyrophosphokinase [Desulfobulbaceae bacterium A2]
MTPPTEITVVSNLASRALGAAVARLLGVEFVEMITRRFADGEIYHAFPCDVSGRDLIIVATTHDDAAFQELEDLIAGGRFWNARSVNVAIPYLGYSTMERAKPHSWEIPKGVTRTRQIFRTRPNYVAFVDLHSEAVLHTHAGEVRTRHLYTDGLVVERIRALGVSDIVLVSPDYGFSKRVARLAAQLGCPHTAADKDRYDVDKTIVGQISCVVRGKTVIICDDMIRTGGSMLQTAERCREAGATAVLVMATHLVLAGNARQRFADNGIGRIIGSDSYPGRVSDELLEVYSLAPLIAEDLAHHLRIADDRGQKSGDR